LRRCAHARPPANPVRLQGADQKQHSAALAEIIGSFYAGFGPTVGGALIGAVWGFVVGFMFFALGASLYNMLAGE
jgi:hypothetical protein